MLSDSFAHVPQSSVSSPDGHRVPRPGWCRTCARCACYAQPPAATRRSGRRCSTSSGARSRAGSTGGYEHLICRPGELVPREPAEPPHGQSVLLLRRRSRSPASRTSSRRTRTRCPSTCSATCAPRHDLDRDRLAGGRASPAGQLLHLGPARTRTSSTSCTARTGPTTRPAGTSGSTSSFQYFIHYHPFVDLFTKELNIWGLQGLLNRRIQVNPTSIPGSPALFDFADYVPDNAMSWPTRAGRGRRLLLQGRVLALQLGAVLPRAVLHRQPAGEQPALRGGAAVVPLHLRPHQHRHGDGRPGHPAAEVLDHQAVLRDHQGRLLQAEDREHAAGDRQGRRRAEGAGRRVA